jgi:hypothetical protein
MTVRSSSENYETQLRARRPATFANRQRMIQRNELPWIKMYPGQASINSRAAAVGQNELGREKEWSNEPLRKRRKTQRARAGGRRKKVIL